MQRHPYSLTNKLCPDRPFSYQVRNVSFTRVNHPHQRVQTREKSVGRRVFSSPSSCSFSIFFRVADDTDRKMQSSLRRIYVSVVCEVCFMFRSFV